MRDSAVLCFLVQQETLQLLAFYSYSGHVELVMKDYHLQIYPLPPFIIHIHRTLSKFNATCISEIGTDS